jgi:hypothetical protein
MATLTALACAPNNTALSRSDSAQQTPRVDRLLRVSWLLRVVRHIVQHVRVICTSSTRCPPTHRPKTAATMKLARSGADGRRPVTALQHALKVQRAPTPTSTPPTTPTCCLASATPPTRWSLKWPHHAAVGCVCRRRFPGGDRPVRLQRRGKLKWDRTRAEPTARPTCSPPTGCPTAGV